MAFGEESGQLIEQLREYLAGVTDRHTRDTVAAWARAWDDVAPELTAALDELAVAAGEGKLTRAQVTRSRRLINALDTIEGRLGALVNNSSAHAIQSLRGVVEHAGSVTDQIIGSQLPAGEHQSAWSRVDPRQVDGIVNRSTQQITKVSYPLASEATAAMKRNLVRGVLTGANPREVAQRMVRQAEQGFNGGLTRALTIARTEILDAHRNAAQLAELQNRDVVAGWVWVASLGARTCPACWAMNGEEFPITEPGPAGHQNCRCVRMPKTKSWRELGFNIDEPRSILPNSGQVFGSLTRDEQLQILGPARFQAWQAGNYPMSRWATKVSNPGWRSSIVTSRAPAAGRPKPSSSPTPRTPAPMKKTTVKAPSRGDIVKPIDQWPDGTPPTRIARPMPKTAIASHQITQAELDDAKDAIMLGRHGVLVEAKLGNAQLKGLLDDIAHVIESAGDRNLPAMVFKVPLNDPAFKKTTLAYVNPSQPRFVHIRPQVARGLSKKSPSGWHMPAGDADEVTVRQYTLAHEIGHVVDLANDDSEIRRVGLGLASSADSRTFHHDHIKELSRYGRNNPMEGYAEGFAQHTLGGPDSSSAAEAYRKKYGWRHSTDDSTTA